MGLVCWARVVPGTGDAWLLSHDSPCLGSGEKGWLNILVSSRAKHFFPSPRRGVYRLSDFAVLYSRARAKKQARVSRRLIPPLCRVVSGASRRGLAEWGPPLLQLLRAWNKILGKSCIQVPLCRPTIYILKKAKTGRRGGGKKVV